MEEVREEEENGAEVNLSAGTKREIPHGKSSYRFDSLLVTDVIL